MMSTRRNPACAIEGMLYLFEELQNSQLEFRESLVQLRMDITDLKESTKNLNDISQRHERRIEQLIELFLTGEIA